LTEFYSLAKIIEVSNIYIADNDLYIYTMHELHKNQLYKKRNYDKLSALCKDIFAKEINLQIMVANRESKPADDDGLNNIINVLGNSFVDNIIEE